MNEKDKYTAAICAAPYVLSVAGILGEKKATSYPTFQEKLKAREIAGDERVVTDGKVITSQGPGRAIEFALKLVEILYGEQKTRDVAQSMLVVW